jgi:hypothetical protein
MVLFNKIYTDQIISLDPFLTTLLLLLQTVRVTHTTQRNIQKARGGSYSVLHQSSQRRHEPCDQDKTTAIDLCSLGCMLRV